MQNLRTALTLIFRIVYVEPVTILIVCFLLSSVHGVEGFFLFCF